MHIRLGVATNNANLYKSAMRGFHFPAFNKICTMARAFRFAVRRDLPKIKPKTKLMYEKLQN